MVVCTSTIDGYNTALSPYAHMLNSLLENDGSFNMRESVYFAKKGSFLATDDDLEKQIENSGKKYLFANYTDSLILKLPSFSLV